MVLKVRRNLRKRKIRRTKIGQQATPSFPLASDDDHRPSESPSRHLGAKPFTSFLPERSTVRVLLDRMLKIVNCCRMARLACAFLWCGLLSSWSTTCCTTIAFMIPTAPTTPQFRRNHHQPVDVGRYHRYPDSLLSSRLHVRHTIATTTTTRGSSARTSSIILHGFNPFSYFVPGREKLRNRMKNYFSSSSDERAARNKKFEADRRQRIREEIQELEEEDFLFLDAQPKILIHERDFFRQAARISAWDEYVVVSILCASISFGALNSYSLNPDHVGIYFYEVILRSIIQVVASGAVLTGLYSTMVFSLSILYGKTALGLERDVQYDNFLEKTQDIRDAGFLAFSASLALFAVLVVLMVAEDLPLVAHLPIGGILVGALYFGFRDWTRLVIQAVEIFVDDEDD